MTEAADKGVSRQENGCMFLHGKESHTLTHISRLLPGIGSICALTQAAHHQPWLSVAEESQVSVCVCVWGGLAACAKPCIYTLNAIFQAGLSKKVKRYLTPIMHVSSPWQAYKRKRHIFLEDGMLLLWRLATRSRQVFHFFSMLYIKNLMLQFFYWHGNKSLRDEYINAAYSSLFENKYAFQILILDTNHNSNSYLQLVLG